VCVSWIVVCPFVFFLLVIVLSVLLRYTDSDYPFAGADPGFQVRGAHLNKLHRAEGGANIFGIFRVKNHDFTPKNHIFFFNFRGGRAPPLLWYLRTLLDHYCLSFLFKTTRSKRDRLPITGYKLVLLQHN
jgi:hypothetical protein